MDVITLRNQLYRTRLPVSSTELIEERYNNDDSPLTMNFQEV